MPSSIAAWSKRRAGKLTRLEPADGTVRANLLFVEKLFFVAFRRMLLPAPLPTPLLGSISAAIHHLASRFASGLVKPRFPLPAARPKTGFVSTPGGCFQERVQACCELFTAAQPPTLGHKPAKPATLT
jgi:hypothetical protein